MPIQGQITEVRSAVAQPAASTAAFMEASTNLLAPGADVASALSVASNAPAGSDTSVLGAGPEAAGAKRERRNVIETRGLCRVE